MSKTPTLRLSLRLRGAQVQWVYPSPDNHDPEHYFRKDAMIYWYEFKSTSTKRELMSQPKFCGHEPGPRTHFVIEATCAYSIVEFSFFGEEEAEVLVRPPLDCASCKRSPRRASSPQVLFRPLAELCITDAVRNIIDAKEARDIRNSGFPDMVMLTQLDGADEGAARPVAPPPHAPNAPHAPATPQPMAPAASAAAVERAVADADPAALVALFQACAIGARTPVARGVAILADAPPGQSSDPMRGALAAAGALPPLVAMLGDGTAEERAAAAEALWKLARNEANRAAIVAAGALEPLAALVRDGDAQGKANAASALWSLAAGDAAIKAAIVAAGALVPLAALVRDGDAQGKANAAGALSILQTR